VHDWSEVRRLDREGLSYSLGELLQADWWDTGEDVPVGKDAYRRAHSLVATLPFSAAHPVAYTHVQTTTDAVPALFSCLSQLGGVLRKLVVDNDTSLVVRYGRARSRATDELAGLLGAPARRLRARRGRRLLAAAGIRRPPARGAPRFQRARRVL
jgi:hypothetical protein